MKLNELYYTDILLKSGALKLDFVSFFSTYMYL